MEYNFFTYLRLQILKRTSIILDFLGAPKNQTRVYVGVRLYEQRVK